MVTSRSQSRGVADPIPPPPHVPVNRPQPSVTRTGRGGAGNINVLNLPLYEDRKSRAAS